MSDGVLFLRSQNIHPEGLVLDDVAYIPINIDNEMKNTRVEKGDVLLNITGASIGRCTVYDINKPANVNQHVCILRTKSDLVLPQFLANYLQCRIGQKMIAAVSTKGNREGLNFQQLGSIPLVIPPLDDQQLFCERIAQAQKTSDIIRNRSNSLRYISYVILSKLMGDVS